MRLLFRPADPQCEKRIDYYQYLGSARVDYVSSNSLNDEIDQEMCDNHLLFWWLHWKWWTDPRARSQAGQGYPGIRQNGFVWFGGFLQLGKMYVWLYLRTFALVDWRIISYLDRLWYWIDWWSNAWSNRSKWWSCRLRCFCCRRRRWWALCRNCLLH